MTNSSFRALYYPYSRTIDETTLKRAVLLYDEILFVDPMSPRARAGLFDVNQHLPYLPTSVAQSLAADWQEISGRYELLEREGLLRLIDPTAVVEDSRTGALIANALHADLADDQARNFFDDRYPGMWSMLRSRIPRSAYQYLIHQMRERVVGPAAIAGGRALYIDGHPAAAPSTRGVVLPDDGRDYAAMMPFLAGSSLATSTALALALVEDAIPLTDSDAHFRLLSLRMSRAAAAATQAELIPGLTPRPAHTQAQAHKAALVQHKVVDSVVSHADLEALSLEDCLRYRERTADERAQFRAFLVDIVKTTRAEPWSPDIEAQIQDKIDAARQEINAHAKAMRATYRSLFNRTLTGLAIATAPALVTAVFPAVTPLMALALGGGPLAGLLVEPLKSLMTELTNRNRPTNSLAYLMDLPKA